MRFEGFGEHAVEFYDGLVADNTKAYWTDNKVFYTEHVRAPMEALLAELEPEFGGDTGLGRAKVFRPHRDTRFAADKTPYKDHCGGVVERGRGGGAYYVQLGPNGLLVAGGGFHFEPDQLARYRAAAAEERRGGELDALVAALVEGGWQLRGTVLKTSPRGYPADHPRIGLLRHRSLWLGRTYEPDDALHDRGTLRRVRTGWRALRPVNEWFADHVGPTEPK
jgi:uncharacterized protein (TIGR02453 family)